MSAFGNLYSAYLRASAEKLSSIMATLRWLCYVIAATVVLISGTNIFVIAHMAATLSAIFGYVDWLLYLIVVLISVPPVVIAIRMYKDASA